MKKIAYKEMFENEMQHAWYVATRLLMLSFLKKYLREDAKILDAGCGTGGTMTFLKSNGYKKIIGIDGNRTAIFYCKVRGHKVVFGSVNKLPFKSASFDAVICLDVLYHNGVRIDYVLEEFYRVLKPNGILYSQEPAINWLRGRHDLYIETKHRFSRKEIINNLELNRFKLVKASYFNSILLPIILVRRLSDRVSIRKSGSDVSKVYGPLNYLLLKVLLFEAFLVEKIFLPFGLTVITLSKK